MTVFMECPLMAKFATVFELVAQEKPNTPVHITRPHAIKAATKWFLNNFPGTVVYAVKTNPEAHVLDVVHGAGVRHFDVASLYEIKQIATQFPDAHMHFMHPVKNREAIRAAYFDYGIRDFSLDSYDELQKILEVTGYAEDLNLFVRLAISNGHAAFALAGKFGIPILEAAGLLRECQKYAAKTAICFHVGSQCMNPDAYSNAITLVANWLKTNKLSVDVVDIGGGFPSIYPDLLPPALKEYTKAIAKSFKKIQKLNPDCALWCEPGRALVAEGGSLLVRVELRKGNKLYINDGVYGTLFDAGYPGFVYPARMIAQEGRYCSHDTEAFSLYGPTCDSLDTMEGPFMLPSNIEEGDWIELGQLGAYGSTLQSNFNGFYSDAKAELKDAPMMSLYGLEDAMDDDIEQRFA
jgi:ornithine decarboxylase